MSLISLAGSYETSLYSKECKRIVMSDTPILSLYSWDPSIGCYAADH